VQQFACLQARRPVAVLTFCSLAFDPQKLRLVRCAELDEGKGRQGSAASCAELQANGGMTWARRYAS
jgi:hypothetical protein